MFEKIKSLLSSENIQAFISYFTSGGLISWIFLHINGIDMVLQVIGGLIGIAIGVQRFIHDRMRWQERNMKGDWKKDDSE